MNNRKGRGVGLGIAIALVIGVIVVGGTAFLNFAIKDSEAGKRALREAFPHSGTTESISLEDAQTKVRIFKSFLDLYKLHTGEYPHDLKALFTKHAGVNDWEERSLIGTTVPRDWWDHDYKLAVPGKHNSDSFDVWSMGPDGIDGTSDDIGNW